MTPPKEAAPGSRAPADEEYLNARRPLAGRAAAGLGVALGEFLTRRPLMSIWHATKDGESISLVVLDERAGDGERRRFVSSARRMAELSATVPGVQRVRDCSSDPAAFVADRRAGTMEDLTILRWSAAQLAGFLRQVTKILAGLHERGVVHGCLCPANVVLDDELHAVLTEINLVSVSESFGGDPDDVFGYGAYAAPEVRESGRVDARSDVFSIGRLLEYLTVGKTPKDPSVGAAPDANRSVLDIVRRCTDESPEARYASAADVLAALEPLVHALGGAESSASGPEAAGRTEVRQGLPIDAPARVAPRPSYVRKLLAAVGALLLLASCAFAYFVGPRVVRPEALAAVLAVGGGLVTLVVPTLPRWPAARFVLALGCALLLYFVQPNPVQLAYRRGAEKRLHGDDVSRARAVLELVRLGRDLRGAQLGGLNLADVDLVAADLRGADLRGADLSRAKLWGAMLAGAVLDGAHLMGTDLTQAAVDEAMGFRTAECDGRTRLPEDWRCLDRHPTRTAQPP